MKTIIISGGEINIKELSKYDIKCHNIIAVDKGLEALYKLKIVPNHVVGDFDSVQKEVLEIYKKDSKIVFHEYNPIKDNTDTDIAIKLAIELNSSEIIIIGALGKRIDHALSNIHVLKEALDSNIPCYIIDEHNKIYLTKNKAIINKKQAYGKYISLIPLTSEVEGLTLTGLKYPLKNAVLTIGKSLGVSNEIIEDTAKIELKKGILIIIESRD